MNIFDNNQTMPRCVSQYWCFLWAPFSKLYGTCALFALRKVPETEVLYQSHIESPQKMTKNENKWKILHLGPQKIFIFQNPPKTQFCQIWHLCPFRSKVFIYFLQYLEYFSLMGVSWPFPAGGDGGKLLTLDDWKNNIRRHHMPCRSLSEQVILYVTTPLVG